MPSLLSLPNELLNHIIDDVHIDDIEAFSSCCKHVQSLAATRLEKHLARKLSFSTLTLGPEDAYEEALRHPFNDDTATSLDATYVLKDFLMDEKNALYPRFMSIRGVGRTRDDNKEMLRALVTQYLDQHDGLEDKIVARVTQIQDILHTAIPAVEAHDWIDRIKKGDFDATVALLITLFPNVRTLRVTDCPNLTETSLIRTSERLTCSAAKHDPQAYDAFKELSDIEISSRHHTVDGKLVLVFLGLPSIQSIIGHKVVWLTDNWPYGPVNSRIKVLKFNFSDIASRPLTSCLKRIETLERFTYNSNLTYSFMIKWEPRLIVKTLRQYAWRTLVHLELTGDPSGVSSNLADGEPFIGTLRSFQSLENIRLMSMMLFKPVDEEDINDSEDCLESDIEGTMDESEDCLESDMEDTMEGSEDDPESAVEDTSDDTSLVEPRRLVDFLPASAKKLGLVGGISDEEARDMFADLPQLKRERVPALTEVVLEDSEPLERETKDLCRNAGVWLKSVKRVVHLYQRIYVVTKPAAQLDST